MKKERLLRGPIWAGMLVVLCWLAAPGSSGPRSVLSIPTSIISYGGGTAVSSDYSATSSITLVESAAGSSSMSYSIGEDPEVAPSSVPHWWVY